MNDVCKTQGMTEPSSDDEKSRVYSEYYDKVTAYVRGKIANPHEAEDVVSSVFLRIFERFDSYDPSRASVSTWIYRITHNAVVDYYRSRKLYAEYADYMDGEIDEMIDGEGGGEPMAHKYFFEILEGIHKRGMYVKELNTNGFYIDQEALDRMKAIGCNPKIKISFDGIGHHDWLRNRKGAEADAMRAIKLCIDNGFNVKVQTNVHRQNVETMLPTAKLLDEMGVSEMRIIRTTEAPRWNENAKGATLDIVEYFDRMLEFACEYMKGNGKMIIDIWQFLTLFPQSKSYRMRPVECAVGEYRDSIPVCRSNRGKIAVAANGNVFPCMQMSGYYESKGDILGNVKRNGLQPLLQYGKYLSEVCCTVGELAEVNETCGGCAYFKQCAGGCRAIALMLTGDKLGTDQSKCLFFKKKYYQKVEQVMAEWRNIMPIRL